MPVSVCLLGWSASGLRCPDHSVSLTPDGVRPFPITLVQMPNGTGKTTTLKLLRAALSGSAQDGRWSPETVREFRKKGSTADEGRFEVTLSVDDKRVTIIMKLDFVEGTVSYLTTRLDGQVTRFDPPHSVARFLSPDFVEYFVFDGELAADLLNREHTSAETIMDRLFQTHMLKIIQSWSDQHWQDHASTMGAVEERGFTRRKNRVTQLRQRLGELERRRSDLTQKLSEAEARLGQQQAQYQSEISIETERNNLLRTAEATLTAAELDLATHTVNVLNATADPHALSPFVARAIQRLKIGLDRVKLPESAAREWFHELAAEAHCVCGRPITDDIRQAILDRAEHYLGTDDVALLNSMKSAIHDLVGDSIDVASDELNSMLATLQEFAAAETGARNKRDRLRDDVGQSDPRIRAALEAIKKLEADARDYSEELEALGSRDDSLKDEAPGIPVIRDRLEKAENHLAEITGTLEIRARSNALSALLDTAYANARARISEAIRDQTNARIQRLLPHNSIRVSDVGASLQLEGQRGGSMGEQLSVAYAFLATLFEQSSHELPFVVDSPAGALDPDVRREIGRMVPLLGKQYVAFTIASEREAFVPAIARYSQSEVHYLTMFRKNIPKHASLMREMGAEGAVTADGVVVEGQEFFNRFQESTNGVEDGDEGGLSS